MGFSDLGVFLKQPNTECVALCDVDQNVLQKRIIDVEKIQDKKPVVQIGQHQRSDKHWKDAIEYLHSGKLGRIRTIRVWAYLDWVGSVPVVPDSKVPKGVDYDFWKPEINKKL